MYELRTPSRETSPSLRLSCPLDRPCWKTLPTSRLDDREMIETSENTMYYVLILLCVYSWKDSAFQPMVKSCLLTQTFWLLLGDVTVWLDQMGGLMV